MKKNLIVYIALLTSLISLNTLSLNAQAANRTDYIVVEGTMLKASTKSQQEKIEKEVEIYNRLPESIRKILVDNNIYYTLIDENIDSTTSGHNGTTYFTGWNLKDVWSEGRMNRDISFNGTIMIHEIGHVLDTYLYDRNNCLISSTPEWVDIYNKNKNIIKNFGGLSKYEVGCSEEAFCEAFAHFINNPKMVKEKTPDVYTYFENLLSTINVEDEDDINYTANQVLH